MSSDDIGTSASRPPTADWCHYVPLAKRSRSKAVSPVVKGTMEDLLQKLSQSGVTLDVDGEKLRVTAPPGVVTPDLREEIDAFRSQLIEAVVAEQEETDSEPFALPRIVPDPAARYEPFPLTDVQHAYWVGRNGHVELGSVSTHIYFELECGALDAERLNKALRRVIDTHDMLRAIVDVDGQQRVLRSVPPYEIEVHDLRHVEVGTRDAELRRIRSEKAAQTFDATEWPLFDLCVVRIDDEHSRLCVSWDFLMVDAWSLIIIFKQWYRLYHDPDGGIPRPDLSFRDYVLASTRIRESPHYARAKQYWWNRLDTLPLAPLLPIRKHSQHSGPQEFTRRELRLGRREWEELKVQTRRLGLTPTSALMAAFSEVVSRWSKIPHYCLNLTMFNRLPMHPGVGSVVGDFTSLMPLEVNGLEGGTFLERALRLQAQFLRDFEHRQVSAVEVLRECAKRRDLQGQAALPVVFTSTLMLDRRRSDDTGALEQFGRMGYGLSQTPQVWLDCQVFEVDGELVIKWDAVDELFFPDVLDDMLQAYRELLDSMSGSREIWERTETVSLPPRQVGAREVFNGTGAEVSEACLHEPVVARAIRQPDAVAAAHAGETMTYGALLADSVLVADRLLSCGVQPNDLVGVVMERGFEQVIALLAILIAGGAYLPVDPRWPALRRDEVLAHGGVRFALTQHQLADGLQWPDRVERIVVEWHADATPLELAPPVRQTSTDLAYVIFTSGSTGQPKGVMIDHRGALNTVSHVNRLFGIRERDRVLAVSDLTFDLSVYDVFGLLTAGGTIVMPDADRSRDPSHWIDLILRWRVTVWNSAPQLLGMLLDGGTSATGETLDALRLVLLSGDWIPLALPAAVRGIAPSTRIVSLGGATEGAIWSIYYPIDEVAPTWDSIPYGTPLPNQHMYVLNKAMKDCPDYVDGDIYIGGRGVAAGYWRDPERTARQFVTHPATHERLYSTGDVGRIRPEGYIEFLGREDSQVKIRGHRVELDEIAACLKCHHGVRDAAVRMVSHNGRPSLAAFVVPKSEERNGSSDPGLPSSMAQGVLGGIEVSRDRWLSSGERERLGVFADFWRRAEQVALRSMLETLDELGLLDDMAASERMDDLIRGGRVLPQYRRLVSRWLAVLAEAGMLVEDGGRYAMAATPGPPGETATHLLVTLERDYGSHDGIQGVLEHFSSCLRARLELLSGQVSPLSLLFPDGTWRLAEALYQTNPVAHYHNEMLGAVVRRIVDRWGSDRTISVLEVGAGIGGTSSAILPHLPPARTTYLYTDVSSFFLAGAKEKFARYPFVDFATFDINKDPASHGLRRHSYDLIVAANVLHNATDVDSVLAEVHRLLRPAGYLLLLEGSRASPWMWTTVGYLDLVHEYSDARATSGDPALTGREWVQALSACFAWSRVIGATDGEAGLAELLEAMPQSAIVAQSTADSCPLTDDSLAAFLRERLPEYMVPRWYRFLDRLPVTTNGKVDLAALPTDSVAEGTTQRTVVKADSGTETRVLEIWRDVLGTHDLGVTDNFFEAGGDSLLLIEVLRRLNESERCSLTVADLFAAPTIRSLAAHLDSSTSGPATSESSDRAGSDNDADGAGDAIAIIGMAGRFPDAGNIDEFWQNVLNGRCSVRSFTDEELIQAGHLAEEIAHESFVRAGTVLGDIETFDAPYFGVTPREAEVMDPQQRLLLECAVEALENAGYASEIQAGRIGVFVGKGTSLYLLQHVLPHPDVVDTLGRMHVLNLNEKDYAATLVSYKLNLTGPSVSINTACSTSLVAVHHACQSLLSGECDVAISGAASLVSTAEKSGYVYQEGQILSPNGQCHPFADDANGTVFGSGVGLVVLKRVADALRDNDHIHALVHGTAVNNDGAMKLSFTAPSPVGQAAAIREAQRKAGIGPDAVQMLEAHGTGTALGDPVEFDALRRVFGASSRDGFRCALGSVKGNIGHLDAAAGIAGLIKVVQALKHRTIPPTLHAAVPSSRLSIHESPFYLNTEAISWEGSDGARRAGVSSFGVGGTNAHVILGDAPAATPRPDADDLQLLPVSARSPAALGRIRAAVADHLSCHTDLGLGDVALTLQQGRRAYPHRAFTVSGSLSDAVRALSEDLGSQKADGRQAGVVFLFPGQGSQERDATWGIYRQYRRFRSALDECAEIVREQTGQELRAWLYSAWTDGASRTEISETAVTQPVLFSLEYALAQLWQSMGVRPSAMVGHSLGEYVAACISGVVSLEEALSLVTVRGQLLQSMAPGRMLAIGSAEESLREVLPPTCSIAAVNAADQCVVSGPIEDIEVVERKLRAASISVLPLRTTRAFHSPMVEPFLERYEQCVAEVRLTAPRIPFVSCVTGSWISDADATSPAYWARHLREPVRFVDALHTLSSTEHAALLEVGPGRTLTGLARRFDKSRSVISTLGAATAASETRAFLQALGALWVRGVDIDWEGLHEGRPRGRVPLPTYSFDRERHWLERQAAANDPGRFLTDASFPTSRESKCGVEDSRSPHQPCELETEYIPPGNAVEERLVEIWRRHLGVDRIGMRDSFFAFGGDSLTATRIHAEIRREFGVELPLERIFELDTVRRIELFIRVQRNPEVVDELTDEELDDCIAMMEQ